MASAKPSANGKKIENSQIIGECKGMYALVHILYIIKTTSPCRLSRIILPTLPSILPHKTFGEQHQTHINKELRFRKLSKYNSCVVYDQRASSYNNLI